MDSIERMEITDQIEEPLNQAKESFESIKNNKKILKTEETEELIEEIDENLKDIIITMKEVQEGGSLTINGLRADVEKLSSNSKKFTEELNKNKIDQLDQFSIISVKNFTSNALNIKNIINNER